MPKFQDKPTVVTNDLSNTTAYFPMVQSGLNKKATIPQIKRDAVANCSTAAGTVAKTATIRNMPDFELLSGIVVTVAFTNTNTAESPTLNINNTGAWPIKLENQASNVTIGNGCWVAGAILEFKYVEVSDTEKYWLLVGHNVAQQTSEYTILADGKIEQYGTYEPKIAGETYIVLPKKLNTVISVQIFMGYPSLGALNDAWASKYFLGTVTANKDAIYVNSPSSAIIYYFHVVGY